MKAERLMDARLTELLDLYHPISHEEVCSLVSEVRALRSSRATDPREDIASILDATGHRDAAALVRALASPADLGGAPAASGESAGRRVVEGVEGPCDHHPGTDPHYHCVTCGCPVWADDQTEHECPPGFDDAPRSPPPPAGADPRDALRDLLGVVCHAHGANPNFPESLARLGGIIEPAARAALRALSPSSGPALAEWYEADGSVTMLPAEEVTRRRKLAAKAIEAAERAVATHLATGKPESDDVLAIWRALRALDAAPSSDTGKAP